MMLDGGEFAIYKEVGIPRGRLLPDSIKQLSNNEVQFLYSAGSSNLSSVRWYISQGINPNTYDENRTSPLHIAARQGSLQIIKELLSSGACINLTDCAGWTPLHVAAYYGRASAANELLIHGADFALSNRRGETPWDLAGNDSTQQVFQRFCQEKDSEMPTLKKPVDLSTLELASVLQNLRYEQSTPIIEESSSVANPLMWTAGTQAINNQLYSNPSNRMVEECINLFNTEPLKGFSFLVALGCVRPSATEIAKFLLTNRKLNKHAIGFVLGQNSWFHKDIANEYMKLIGFAGLHIVAALRKVISRCKLPKEGTRVTNILSAFATSYSKENLHFGGADAIQGLCFSIIMIELQSMDKKEFFNSAKGLLEGKDYPESVLTWIYEEISKNPLFFDEESFESQYFGGFEMEGLVCIQKKILKIGVIDDIVIFLSQNNNSPYAVAILRDCEVNDSWLQGSVAIKANRGIITAKFNKEGRVRVKRESMLVFKSEEWRKWVEVIKGNMNCDENEDN